MYTGPHIIKDGLVFGYDTGYGVADPGVSTRFYSGKPTVNLGADRVATLHDSSGSAAATVVDAPEKGAGWKKVTITARGTNFRVIQFGSYVSFAANTLYSESFEADWGNMRGKGYFLTFDGSGGGTRNWFKNRSYTNGVTSNIAVDNTLLDGHIGGNITKSSTHVHVWFLYNNSTSTTGLNDYFYYKDLQIELGTIPTPFVNGTRSSTASLIDLKETTSIDVSNVSFDSTGQPIFDGTDDRIVSDAILVEGSQTFETVFTPTESAHSPTAILTNHSYTSPVANFGINYVSGNKLGASIGYTDGTREFDQKITSGAVWVNGSNVAVHAVFTYNATANQIKWYINGELDATYNLSKTPNFQSIPVCSGSWVHNYNDYWFGGQIHVGKIYNRELSATEAKQNFNAYKNRFSI